MKKLTTEGFIKRAKEVHGDKYDYSKSNVVKAHEKVCIVCPIHGEFLMTPSNHLFGQGCPRCRYNIISEKLSKNKEYFIRKANEIHNNKYDYLKVSYTNNSTKVCIICPEHGEFWQTPNHHLRGQGCPKCGNKLISLKKKVDSEYFINKANKLHNYAYDYSKVDYVNAKSKVCIICHKHGEFWQTPSDHIAKKGCPVCSSSKLEIEIMNFLCKNNISYEHKKHFDWLGNQHLDFYLPKYNIAIECQGGQHFALVEHFGGLNGLKKRIYRDTLKHNLCTKNNVKLLYYSNLKIKYPYKVITDKNNLLKIIKENEK